MCTAPSAIACNQIGLNVDGTIIDHLSRVELTQIIAMGLADNDSMGMNENE